MITNTADQHQFIIQQITNRGFNVEITPDRIKATNKKGEVTFEGDIVFAELWLKELKEYTRKGLFWSTFLYFFLSLTCSLVAMKTDPSWLSAIAGCTAIWLIVLGSISLYKFIKE